MAQDDAVKPTDPTPPSEEKAEAEPEAAAAPAPPDPVQQVSAAAHQVGASVDTALKGVAPENRVMLVAIVSIFVGGWLGSILNGQVMKGIAILVAYFVLVPVAFVIGALTFGLGFLIPLIVHVLLVIDAISIANRKTKGEVFGEWDFFYKPQKA